MTNLFVLAAVVAIAFVSLAPGSRAAVSVQCPTFWQMTAAYQFR